MTGKAESQTEPPTPKRPFGGNTGFARRKLQKQISLICSERKNIYLSIKKKNKTKQETIKRDSGKNGKALKVKTIITKMKNSAKS